MLTNKLVNKRSIETSGSVANYLHRHRVTQHFPTLEELSKLNDFFSATTTTRQFERTSIRTYYSNVDISSSASSSIRSSSMPRRANYYQEPYKNSNKDQRHNSCRDYSVDSSYDNGDQYQSPNDLDINHNQNRAPILPPIGYNGRQKQVPVQNRQSQFVHQNTDEETSGYLSDRMSPLMWVNQMQQQPMYQQQHSHQQSLPKDYSNYIYPSSGDELAPELDAMKIDERRRIPKHKTPVARGFDEDEHETDYSMPKSNRKDKEERAKWGERKGSSLKLDGPCWLERGFVDSGDESVRSYSFIRGQNAPIDPNVLAERTTKRIKAIELQNAIKAQVEERERLRKLELEKTLLEERRLEESLRQQRESNEQRFEEEQRMAREKIEREQHKQEMMRAAIEKARQEAELEKSKKKRSAYSNHEFESKTQNTDSNEQVNIPREDSTPTRVRVPKPPISPSSDDYVDDDEKILIGTPIRMKKKTLNKTSRMPAKKETSVQDDKDVAAAPETNIDGIALVLQTLPPIIPALSNDIISLNQNINTLNTSNIQLAVMLAHQMQQFGNIAQNQTQQLNQTQHLNQTPAPPDNKMNARENNLTGKSSMPSNRDDDEKRISDEVCKQCTNNFNQEDAVNQDETSLGGHQCSHKDAATVTDDVLVSELHSKASTFDKKNELSQVSDASTQTDQKLEYCFQCRYHHCHHHHVIVKDLTNTCADDVKTIAINHPNSKAKCTEKECASAVGTRNVCNESKEPIKLEDRPKWGVNRPSQQYRTASERDPFYLRNKRKKHQKQQFSEEQNRRCHEYDPRDNSTHGSRSVSPSPSIITNSTVTLSSPALKNRKRSICTEILPIKTDMNGRVYLNFNEASLHVTEDEDKPSAKQHSTKSRMVNRCQTANDIHGLKVTENNADDILLN